MKNIWRPLGLTLALSFLAGSAAPAAPPKAKKPSPPVRARPQPTRPKPPADWRSELTALIAAQPRTAEISIAAVDVAGGTEIFGHQPARPLKPASLMKLFTTVAALERFGPTFQYETRVYLRGDELWVVGAGDPAIGDFRLAERDGQPQDHVFASWTAALAGRGVTELRRIVLDDGVFDAQARNADWPVEQQDRWHQAPVGGLNVNDNCLDAEFVSRGGRLELQLKPDLPADFVRNDITVGRQQRVLARRTPKSDVFLYSGTITRAGEIGPISARDSSIFFAGALQKAIEKSGIRVREAPLRQRMSPDEQRAAEPIAVHHTPLADVMWRANNFSQNLFAECLIKTLAAYEPDGRRAARCGSWEMGRAIVERTIASLGVDMSNAVIRDGSGLSHRNRATAAQFAQLLYQVRRHPHADWLVDTLAAPGQPGTMRNRYLELAGSLRGKTGTLIGVTSLAGYLRRTDGGESAFAILVNGECRDEFMTRVCQILRRAEPGR